MLNRYNLGVKLMSWGASLCLSSSEDKEKFKLAINGNTLLGSHVDSGGHIHGHIQPLCDYDTQSIINVLNQQLLINGNNQLENSSEKIEYYKERWK